MACQLLHVDPGWGRITDIIVRDDRRLQLWSSFIDRVLANDPPAFSERNGGYSQVQQAAAQLRTPYAGPPHTGPHRPASPPPPPKGVFGDPFLAMRHRKISSAGGGKIAPKPEPKQEELTLHIIKGPRRHVHSGVYPKGYLDSPQGISDKPEMFVRLNGPDHLIKDMSVRYARQGEDGKTQWHDLRPTQDGSLELSETGSFDMNEDRTDPQFVLPTISSTRGLLRVILESDEDDTEPPYKLDIRLG